MSVSKSWTFTRNNYNSDDLTFFLEWQDYLYLVFGKEVAPTTGTPHLQGYFTLRKAVRPSYLKRVLPRGTHFEIAQKPLIANFRYCSKSHNYTVVDRRYNRDGVPHPVTDAGHTSGQPQSSQPTSSDDTMEHLVTTFSPKFSFKTLFSK